MNKKKLKEKRKSLQQKAGKRIVGYHVYRSVNENLPFVFWERLTDEPIREGNFNDPTAEIGQRYYYKMTQAYSDETESQPVTPKTTFTDHAGNEYEQNPLVDFVGYNMYRSADKNVPLEQWEKRNDAPIPTLEYKDEGVQSGEIYFYYVRAVDSNGNESAPGEILRVIRK